MTTQTQKLVLVQTRLPQAVYKKLMQELKGSSDVSVAALVRRILIDHVVKVPVKG